MTVCWDGTGRDDTIPSVWDGGRGGLPAAGRALAACPGGVLCLGDLDPGLVSSFG